MATCKEWMENGYFEKLWNGVQLEEEEKKDVEIRGCSIEREENLQHGMGRQRGMEKKNKTLGTDRLQSSILCT